MAINLGSAYGKISLDASGFIKGINSAKSGLQTFQNSIGGLTSALTALVGTAALLGAAKVIFDIGEKAVLAAARVDELATINQVLAKTAGLSSDAVIKAAQAVKDEGIEAAVAQQVVAEFVRSHLDLSKASDLARVAQDAATISGKNSTEALYGIINGIITLQPEMIRSNGIVINLIQAENEYARSIGKATNELTPMEKQQVALNAVLEAGKNVAGAYEAAMTKGSKIIRSYPRFINDILVNMGGPFLDAFDKAAKALGEFLKELGKMTAEGGSLRPMLDKLAASAGIFVDKFVAFLQNFDVEKFAKGLTTVLDLVIKFATFLLEHQTMVRFALNAIGGALVFAFSISTILNIMKMAERIKGLFIAIESLKVVTPVIAKVFGGLGTVVGSIGLGSILIIIGAIVAQVALLAFAWNKDFLWMQTNFKMWVSIITSLWKALVAFFKGDTASAVRYVNAAFVTLGGRLMGVFNSIATAWAKFVRFIQTPIKFPALPKALTPGSPTPFEVGLNGIADAMGNVSEASRKMASSIAADGVTNRENILSSLQIQLNFFSSYFKELDGLMNQNTKHQNAAMKAQAEATKQSLEAQAEAMRKYQAAAAKFWSGRGIPMGKAMSNLSNSANAMSPYMEQRNNTNFLEQIAKPGWTPSVREEQAKPQVIQVIQQFSSGITIEQAQTMIDRNGQNMLRGLTQAMEGR